MGVEYYYFLGNHTGLTKDPSYNAAKNHNDYYAADRLISEITNPYKYNKLGSVIPPNTMIIPVMSSSNSGNIIPKVFAEKLVENIKEKNLVLCEDLTFRKVLSHTSGKDNKVGTLKRMITPPIVKGEVIKGGNYLLVDDVATSGTTLKTLSNYIRKNGGNVISYVTLARAFSNKGDFNPINSIDVSNKSLDDVLKKFSIDEIGSMVKQFEKFGYQELNDFTDEDLKYLLKYNNPENLEKYINENLKDFSKQEKDSMFKAYSEQFPDYEKPKVMNDPAKKTIRIIIAGGRDYQKYSFLENRMDYLLQKVKNTHNVVIVTGGASGADKLGEFYAKTHGYNTEKHMPDWEKYATNDSNNKNPAGVIRNQEMVQNSTHLVAFWDEKSNGTKNTIINAVKNDLKVRVFNYQNKTVDYNRIVTSNKDQLKLF